GHGKGRLVSISTMENALKTFGKSARGLGANSEKGKLLFGDEIRALTANKTFTNRGNVPKAWLGVPFGEDEFQGIVVIQSYNADILFDEEDKQLLIYVAKYVRNAIERMNHANTLVQTNEELKSSNKALDEARAEAVRTCELKSSFLANMSHEIRTPMTAIIGFTEQAIKSCTTQSERQDYLARVLRSGEHVLHLINEILDLSKIESEKLELEHQNFDLFELVADIGLLLEPMAGDKSLAFNVNYDYPLPKNIDGDLVRIRQVLLNLCANAVKFTHQGSVSLTVTYDTLRSELKFAIKDSGIGMSECELERLFQPFVQADASISRKFGGSGLGLVISQKLVHLMGGRLTVNSVKGKGSCFEVFIPIEANVTSLANRLPMTSLSKPMIVDEANHFASARVLVAEDNPVNQKLIERILERDGHDVVIAENGRVCCDAWQQQPFDIVLM
ncbi:MAG: ATP-binding protein, partial [Psychrosphaera sp.]|nr:ATP-binding protein [Psychrosphaera sp.]